VTKNKILNIIGIIFVTCLFISLSSQVVMAATYYSDFATGSDSNNGTSTSTPWKHMPGMSGWTGSATLSSGDVVVLKGGSHWTFTSTSANLITPPTTITIMGGQQCGFTGSPAVVCDGTTTPCGSNASVSCNGGTPWGSGYPIIDGQGNSTASRSGVYLYPNSNGYGLTIDGIELYNIGDYQNISYGIQIANGSNFTIKNSLIFTYSLDSLAILNTQSNFTMNNIYINDNVFKAQGRANIEAGSSTTTSSIINNMQIYNNIFYGPNTAGAVYTNAGSFHGDGFMIGGSNSDTYGLTKMVIHHNKFIGDWCFNNGTSVAGDIAVTSPLYINGSTNEYSEVGTLIYDNLFEDDTVSCAISTGTSETPWAWGAIGIGHGYHTGVQILNNTIYGSPAIAESAIQIEETNGATATIENNILAKCDNCILLDSTVGAVTMNYNQFWSLNGTHLIYDQRPSVNSRCNTSSACLTQEGTTSGMTYCNDSYSVGNNLFVTLPTQGIAGSGNFNLLADSPVIGQGANESSIFTTDITGTTWTVPWGIGAYQYKALQSTLLVTSVNGTVTSNPSGINCGSTCSANYDSGTSVTLTASPASGYTFTGWSGGECSGTGTCTITMNAATSVTATFARIVYNLNVTKSGTGTGTVTGSDNLINCGSTCSVNYDQGTSVILTASAASGSIFSGWSGGGCSGTGTCTITMNAATSVTATFSPVYSLTVTNATTGEGTVTDSNGLINCGTTCSASYNSGTSVTLTASPKSGYTFTGWLGGGCSGTGTCTITMTGATSVTATFATTVYNLTVTKSGTGAGTVTGGDGLINCGSTCAANYAQGTSITLTAAATSGSVFTGWSGACSGTGNCNVTMTAAKSAKAAFAKSMSRVRR